MRHGESFKINGLKELPYPLSVDFSDIKKAHSRSPGNGPPDGFH
jgi:hypothetical protein